MHWVTFEGAKGGLFVVSTNERLPAIALNDGNLPTVIITNSFRLLGYHNNAITVRATFYKRFILRMQLYGKRALENEDAFTQACCFRQS